MPDRVERRECHQHGDVSPTPSVSTAQHQACQQPSTATLHDSFFFLKSFTDMSDGDLFRAAQRGDLEAVRQLLHEGAPRSVFESAMNVAIWNDHADIVAEMARFVVCAGQTAKYLTVAARHDSVAAARVLISRVIAEHPDNVAPALEQAAQYGNAATAALLIKFDTRPSSRARHDRAHALLAAATWGGKRCSERVVRILIRSGVDVNSTDVVAQTALHHAARFGETRAVALLLHFKADVHLRSADGKTALDLATATGRGETAAALRRFGAT